MANTNRRYLSLNYTQDQLFDPIVSFARASTATRINPTTGLVETVAANVPRLCGLQTLINVADSTQKTIQPGLLIEGSATNVVPYSQTSTGWNFGGGSSFGSLVPSPDNSSNAVTVSDVGGYAYTTASQVAGPMVLSFWAKASANSTFTVEGRSGVSKAGVPVDTVYRKYYYAFTGATGSHTPAFSSLPAGFTFFGVQLESGTFPSSYIPTAGAAVTRAADVATIDVSKICNASEGTLVCEVDFGPQTNAWQTACGQGASLRMERSSDGGIYVMSNSSRLYLGGPSFRTRVAMVITPAGIRASINGGAVQTSALVTPAVPAIALGDVGNGTQFLNSTIQSLQYHRFAFDDVSLQAASVLN